MTSLCQKCKCSTFKITCNKIPTLGDLEGMGVRDLTLDLTNLALAQFEKYWSRKHLIEATFPRILYPEQVKCECKRQHI